MDQARLQIRLRRLRGCRIWSDPRITCDQFEVTQLNWKKEMMESTYTMLYHNHEV